MNKSEYLAALKEALKDTDQDIINEILADYEEHFQAGIENGKTEEEICRELGAIEDLVEEMKEVYGTDSKKTSQEEKAKDSQRGAFRFDKFRFDDINGDTIGDIINSALNSAGEAIREIDVKELSRTVMSTFDQAATAFSDFADSCMNGKGFDTGSCSSKATEGINENTTKSYAEESDNTEKASQGEEEVTKENDAEHSDSQQKAQGQQTAVLSKLVVDGTVAGIIVKKSENGKLNLHYVNNGTQRQKRIYEFYSYQEGDTVYAGVRKVGRTVFLMDFSEKALVITVELPENMELVQLKTVNGSIDVKDCTIGTILVNSVSGNLKLDRISAMKTQLKTVSGNIHIRNIRSERLNGKTVSGNMNLSNVTGECLQANTVSGDILLGVKVTKCYAGSKSGNIDVQSNRDIMLESNNVSGNITIHLNNSENGYQINCKTISGRLTVDYGQQHSGNLKSGTYTYGNQGSNLTLSTVSGSMHLRDM